MTAADVIRPTLSADESAVLRIIREAGHGIRAQTIADSLHPPLTRRRVDTLLDRLSDLGCVESGWRPPPGADITERPSRHWRLSAAGLDACPG